MLTRIEKVKIYEAAVDQIKSQIENQVWSVGDQLPSERDLAEQLGVGRPSIREALRVLEVMGYVEIRPGQGTFVCARDAAQGGAQLLQSMLQEDEHVVELFEVREMFEPQIAYLAAQSATDQDISELEEILQRMEENTRKGFSGVNENIEFHLAIAKSVDNHVLFEMQQLLLKSSKEPVDRYFKVPGRFGKSLVGHREILEAIREHNAEKARVLMLDHLRTRFTVPNENSEPTSKE
jgi:GntR family transcriptional repressor for pyruvate dehydrogenase complex